MRDGHSSWTPVTRRLQQPTRTADPDIDLSDCACAKKLVPSLFGLAPGGVCRAVGVAADAVRSYRTFSPLPRPTQPAAAVRFLWHFPWVHARRTLSGTACPWSPDFPPRRPCGFAGAAVRPTDTTVMGKPEFVVKSGAVNAKPKATGAGRADRATSSELSGRRRRRRAPAGSGAGTPPRRRVWWNRNCR
jgi:hypothetical protein